MQRVNQLLLGAFVAWHDAEARIVSDRGQTLAEYGILVTTVAVSVVVLTMILFRTTLANVITGVSDCLNGSC